MATLLHAVWMLSGSMAYSQCVDTFVLDRDSVEKPLKFIVTLTIPTNTTFRNLLYDG